MAMPTVAATWPASAPAANLWAANRLAKTNKRHLYVSCFVREDFGPADLRKSFLGLHTQKFSKPLEFEADF